jgi:hypothetical protein
LPFYADYDQSTSPGAAAEAIIVMASINGHPPLPFLLDTGSEAPVYLADWAAKSLGLSLNKAAWQSAKPGFHALLADKGITSVNSIKLIGIDKHNNLRFTGLSA